MKRNVLSFVCKKCEYRLSLCKQSGSDWSYREADSEKYCITMEILQVSPGDCKSDATSVSDWETGCNSKKNSVFNCLKPVMSTAAGLIMKMIWWIALCLNGYKAIMICKYAYDYYAYHESSVYHMYPWQRWAQWWGYSISYRSSYSHPFWISAHVLLALMLMTNLVAAMCPTWRVAKTTYNPAGVVAYRKSKAFRRNLWILHILFVILSICYLVRAEFCYQSGVRQGGAESLINCNSRLVKATTHCLNIRTEAVRAIVVPLLLMQTFLYFEWLFPYFLVLSYPIWMECSALYHVIF